MIYTTLQLIDMQTNWLTWNCILQPKSCQSNVHVSLDLLEVFNLLSSPLQKGNATSMSRRNYLQLYISRLQVVLESICVEKHDSCKLMMDYVTDGTVHKLNVLGPSFKIPDLALMRFQRTLAHLYFKDALSAISMFTQGRKCHANGEVLVFGTLLHVLTVLHY